jgi:ribosomal protein S5
MYHETKKNEEFNQFFKDFKEKNKDKWASIINGMELDDDILKQEIQSEKNDEVEMLKEFEQRRKVKSAYDVVDKIEKSNEFINPKKQLKPKKNETKEVKESIEQLLEPIEENGEIYDPRQFHMIFIHADMICNITRLNRVYNRRVLVYIGNKRGLISYAVGRGPLYEDAWLKAYKELRKNLIAIEVDPAFSCPRDLMVRFNDFRLKIYSCPNPSLWGNPIMCLMLRYAGMYHVMFSIVSRNKEPFAMVYAFFKAVTRNVTRQQLLEMRNQKNFKEYIGRPRRFEQPAEGYKKYTLF